MTDINFSKDISDFIIRLFQHNVKYLIVGGEAVIYHGYARLTGDIDFFYDRENENIKNLFNALLEFWEGTIPGISSSDALSGPGTIIQFGQPPNRIDLINEIDGVSFSQAWGTRIDEELTLENQKYTVYYINLEMLIKNKKASGRYKDLDDLKYLEAVRNT